MGENHWIFFLYYTKITFIFHHQVDGRTNPLVYKNQPEGSSNSLNFQAPTWRKLQLPFPCPIQPPYDWLINTVSIYLCHTLNSYNSLDHHLFFSTITMHLIIISYLSFFVSTASLYSLYDLNYTLLRSASVLQYIWEEVRGPSSEVQTSNLSLSYLTLSHLLTTIPSRS